jgi:hypothetical protein
LLDRRSSRIQGTSPGLSVPSTHASEEGPRSADGATARCVPPSGFGYPPGGLLPSTPGRASFIPTAFLGFPLRSVLLPGGGMRFPSTPNPPAVATATYSGAPKRTGQHRDTQLPGFGPPPESRGTPQVFSPRRTGSSPGVLALPGLCRRPPCRRARAPGSPYTLYRDPAEGEDRPALEGITQRPTGPTQRPISEPTGPSPATLLGFACLFNPVS